MPENPALTIRSDFPRPDATLLGAFAALPTGNIVDAQDRLGALDHAIGPVTTMSRFHGAAVVVDAGPRDNLAAWAALKVVKPGDVIVIRTGDHLNAAVIGDNIVAMAKNAGVVGVVTDGVVRDVDALNDVGLPVFARGVTPNSPWKNGPGTVGLEAAVGGVTIRSGDVVVGDVDGVVRVPLESAAAVAEAARAVVAKERGMEAAWRDGAVEPDWLDAALADKGVRWIRG